MIDADTITKTNATFSGLFNDAPALDAAQVRLRPADLARMLKVSRQAVSQWVTGGKLRLDADGRVSAASAVRQLVQHHPERLRASALAPVVREMAALRTTVATLQRDLSRAQDDAEFQTGAASELAAQQGELLRQLETYRSALVRLPTELLHASVTHWLRVFADPVAPADPGSVNLLRIASILRGPAQEGAGHSLPNTANNLENLSNDHHTP